MPESSAELSAAEPRFFDTYSLVYAYILVFLAPGVASLARLPFRTYTFQYVALVTVPFLLGLLAMLLTDNPDPLPRKLWRSAVMIPLMAVTGVAVLFTGSLSVLLVTPLLGGHDFSATTPVAVVGFGLLALPLVFTLIRRFREPLTWQTALQLLALSCALAMVGYVLFLMLSGAGVLKATARKDLVIYITGALTWYLPSFGIAAGAWRRVALV
jgi:hypothetical protein